MAKKIITPLLFSVLYLLFSYYLIVNTAYRPFSGNLRDVIYNVLFVTLALLFVMTFPATLREEGSFKSKLPDYLCSASSLIFLLVTLFAFILR